jgi:hypothetical protein
LNENGALYDFIFIIMSAQKFVKKISAETGKSGILPALTRRELAGYTRWLADFTKISKYYILSFLLLEYVVQCNLPRWMLSLYARKVFSRGRELAKTEKTVNSAQFFYLYFKKVTGFSCYYDGFVVSCICIAMPLWQKCCESPACPPGYSGL